MADAGARNADATASFILLKTLAVVFVGRVSRVIPALGLRKWNEQSINSRHPLEQRRPEKGIGSESAGDRHSDPISRSSRVPVSYFSFEVSAYVAVNVPLFQRLFLFMGFFPAAQPEPEFNVTATSIQGKRDQCQAFLLCFSEQTPKFFLAEKGFSRTIRVIPGKGAGLSIWGNMRAHKVQFAAPERKIASGQIRAAVADRFYFLARQH